MKQDLFENVWMQTNVEVEDFQIAFSKKYYMLKNVYCVLDGQKQYMEQSGDTIIQNMFYKGHYVGNIFVFAPNGVVISCVINAPGEMYDYIITEWGGVYKKIRTVHDETGGKCVVDSEFWKGQYPFLIKFVQDYVMGSDGTAEYILTLQQVTSARQASEWRMRAFQGTLPKLKDRIAYEERG